MGKSGPRTRRQSWTESGTKYRPSSTREKGEAEAEVVKPREPRQSEDPGSCCCQSLLCSELLNQLNLNKHDLIDKSLQYLSPSPIVSRDRFWPIIMVLKKIPSILSPELLFVLAKMGHGDEIVLGDANFPARFFLIG